MMVCALNVNAPFCIKLSRLTIFAAAIASGRKPSKLTIKTRSTLGKGVGVIVGKGVSVGGGVLLGLGITNRVGASVGGGGEANDPQDGRKMMSRVKCKMR